MKSISSILAIAAISGTSLLLANAQESAATPHAKGHSDKAMEWKKHREAVEALPEDLRKRFFEAKEDAMKNPEIQALREKAEAAGKELRDAMRKVIAEKNPELAEQLSTYFQKPQADQKKKDKKHQPGEKFEAAIEKLQPAERSRLEAAREIAKQAPAVQSAEAAMKTAQTPEARREAGKNFRKAMNDAMLTADPSLADVLEKIKPPKQESAPESSSAQAQ